MTVAAITWINRKKRATFNKTVKQFKNKQRYNTYTRTQ